MFEAVLSKDPRDPHASLHLGFVLKAAANEGPVRKLFSRLLPYVSQV